MAYFYLESSTLRRIYYRLEDLLRGPAKLPPESDGREAQLPREGYSVSIEKALNSRCTSDYDGNPKKFHWGMFDATKKLKDDQIKKIISFAEIPRFTDRKIEIQADRNILTFLIENRPAGILKDWLMVEGGMRQQAVGLVCAALGVGIQFSNLGKDGTPISNADFAAIKIRLDPMRPTYDGTFWSNSPPMGRKFQLAGNLPDPVRDGPKPLTSSFADLALENRTSNIRLGSDQANVLILQSN
jgi:hypothetical protein